MVETNLVLLENATYGGTKILILIEDSDNDNSIIRTKFDLIGNSNPIVPVNW